MSYSNRSIAAIAVCVLACGAPVRGAIKQWNMTVGFPGTDATWFQGPLWTPAGVPAAADDVRFGGPLGFNIPTIVQFYAADPGVGYPSAVATSLIADSVVSPVPASSSLTLQMGDPTPGFHFAGSLTVGGGVFNLGTTFESTVNLFSHRWNVRHTSTTERLRVAQNGAFARMSLVEADLDIDNRLDVGRGLHSGAAVTKSDGQISINGTFLDRSTLSVADLTVIGIDGGKGALTIGAATDATFDNTVFVGLQNQTVPGVGVVQSEGDLYSDTFYDGVNNIVPTVSMDDGIQVGVNSGKGEATLIGQYDIQPDATNLAMMVGRGAQDDALNNTVVRGEGAANVSGGDSGGTGFVATGDTFVGIDGGFGSIGILPGGATLNGDLVVGDLGFTSALAGYVPSNGHGSIALNAGLNVNGDVFIGNNNSFGEFRIEAFGDGGSSMTANYVSVGEQGTGLLVIDGQASVSYDHLEIKLASGIELHQLGGNARLGGSGGSGDPSLSVRLLSARGEGDRFDWDAGRLELRDGRIYDWGNNDFTVPEPGFFSGAGRIETDLVNNGEIDVGYYASFPPALFNDSLVVAGNTFKPGHYTQSNDGILRLTGSLPTRLSSNGEETLVVAGNATLDGELYFYEESWTLLGTQYWYDDVLPGDTFKLFDVTGTISGQFDNVPVGLAILPPGLPHLPFLDPSYTDYRWDTTRLYTEGFIVVSLVPEPATLSALATAAMLGLSRRRR
jgi:hypothetical protein